MNSRNIGLRRWGIIALTCTTIVQSQLWKPHAHAYSQQNLNDLPLGGRTGLMAGAGVAQGSDEAVFWLNPAGLGGIDDLTLSLSLNAYGMQMVKVTGHFRDQNREPDDWNDDGYSNKMLVVPASIGFFFNLVGEAGQPWHQVGGLCFLNLGTSNLDYTASLRRSSLIEELAEIHHTNQDTYSAAGAAYAIQFPGRFQAGVSLLLQWNSFSWHVIKSSDTFENHTWSQLSQMVEEEGSYWDMGLFWVLGAQWHSRYLSAGISVRPPRITFAGGGGAHVESMGVGGTVAGKGGSNEISDYTVSKNLQENGIHIGAGLAIHLPRRLTVEVNGSIYTVLGTGVVAFDYEQDLLMPNQIKNNSGTVELEQERRLTWNLALGAELQLGKVALLAGGFTDNSTVAFEEGKTSSLLFYFNRYGATLGLGFGGEQISTYAGLRYTYGEGEFVGQAFNYSLGRSSAAFQPAREHRIMLLLSGAIRFDLKRTQEKKSP